MGAAAVDAGKLPVRVASLDDSPFEAKNRKIPVVFLCPLVWTLLGNLGPLMGLITSSLQVHKMY